MSAWLAIDGGQSTTRLRGSWMSEPAEGAGYAHGPDRIERFIATVEPILRRVGPVPAVTTVAVGHTGMPDNRLDRMRAARILRALTGASRLLMAPDWATAHLGAFGGGPGAVLSAGSGSVALGVDRRGRWRRVDGGGYLLGDDGSAFWIGRRGLRHVARVLDGRGGSAALTEAARIRYGDDLRRGLGELLRRADLVDSVAQFARDVIAVAAAGDAVATHIVQRAAAELASTLADASAHLPSQDRVLAVAGRLLAPEGPLTAAFTRELAARTDGLSWTPATAGSLEGAMRLAAVGPGLHEPLIDTFEELL